MKLDKNKILNEVNYFVNEIGFSNMTFSQIASKLSTTRENIHHHFKTKERLGLMYSEYLYNLLNEHFLNLMGKDISSIEKLKQYFSVHLMHKGKHPSCPVVSLLGEYKLLPLSMQKDLQKLFDLELSIIEKIIEDGIKRKEFRADIDVAKLSHSILIRLKGSVLYENASFDYFSRAIEDIDNDISRIATPRGLNKV